MIIVVAKLIGKEKTALIQNRIPILLISRHQVFTDGVIHLSDVDAMWVSNYYM